MVWALFIRLRLLREGACLSVAGRGCTTLGVVAPPASYSATSASPSYDNRVSDATFVTRRNMPWRRRKSDVARALNRNSTKS